MDKPWMKLYTRDWLDNKELRRCSPTSRAVLADLMCLAHEGYPYGHLTDKLGPLTESFMSARCFVPVAKFREAIKELKAALRINETPAGILFIKRMVHDEEIRLKRAAGGSLGGNPNLTEKVNLDVNHISEIEDNRHSHERTRADSDSVFVSGSVEVKAQAQQSANGYQPQAGWDWFLATYPKHRLNANQDCRLWLSIVEDAYVEGVIREKLPLFKRSAEWRRGVIPSARKFLSDRLFVMEPPPEAEGTAPQKSTKASGYVTSAEWERLYGEKESA